VLGRRPGWACVHLLGAMTGPLWLTFWVEREEFGRSGLACAQPAAADADRELDRYLPPKGCPTSG
jgi:hypothetical protein